MNRIALLQTEEQKAVQKINETKARAQEIRQIKKRNEDTMQEQFSVTLGREIAVKAMNERAVTERQTLRKKLNDSKKAVEDMNKLKASERKEERRRFDEFAQNVRLQTEMEKRKKAEEVKRRCVVVLWGCGVDGFVLMFLIDRFVFVWMNREAALREQREREKQERELAARLEYAQKIETERQRREEAQKLIERLEREEQELIDRLKKAQEEQQSVRDLLRLLVGCCCWVT
jgi:hypothetical protein